MQTWLDRSLVTRQEKGIVRLNHLALLAAVALVVIGIDHLTKAAAFALDEPSTLLGGIIKLDQVRNEGAAFGVLRNVPGSALILTATTIATIGVLALIFRALIRTHLWGGRVALGLIYGGALGNLIDRVSLGHVRDFIKLDLRLFEWPAFNLADVAIVIGIIFLLFGLATMPKHPHKAAAHAADDGPERATPDAAQDNEE